MAAPIARAQKGIARLFGFGMSTVIFAAVSFASIPAMVAADGAAAWGAIALGQAIGGIGGVLVNYGWGLSGPAEVSLASSTVRLRVYGESVRVRLLLLVPVSIAAAVIAGAIAPSNSLFAAAGAVSVTVTGLTGIWYFIGVARPYAYLLLETLPRASGAILGIVMMKVGFDAIVGLIFMTGGSLLSFVIVSMWVHFSAQRNGAIPTLRRPLGELMRSQRAGLVSSVGINLYTAAPIAIVSLLAPAVQPSFALASRIQSQLVMALSPLVQLMQSWVPRGIGRERFRRADASLVIAFLSACISALFLTLFGHELFRWFGGGEISVTNAIVGLVAISVVASLVDATFRYAVLPSFGRLDVVMRAFVVSAVIGLPLVALGAIHAGVAGALTGAIVGVSLRVVVGAASYLPRRRSSVTQSEGPAPLARG